MTAPALSLSMDSKILAYAPGVARTTSPVVRTKSPLRRTSTLVIPPTSAGLASPGLASPRYIITPQKQSVSGYAVPTTPSRVVTKSSGLPSTYGLPNGGVRVDESRILRSNTKPDSPSNDNTAEVAGYDMEVTKAPLEGSIYPEGMESSKTYTDEDWNKAYRSQMAALDAVPSNHDQSRGAALDAEVAALEGADKEKSTTVEVLAKGTDLEADEWGAVVGGSEPKKALSEKYRFLKCLGA
mmetsp:Transcript_119933/g.208278  ORF Transcript_119933/g.208278 Transcript_119933/m.208278 type:complete len:240 (-) Transcript_119933:41-760(-)